MTGLVALLAAATLTGQSPDCERFCMSVKPREAPEGSVFTFRGRHWRPSRRVGIEFGAYCRPDEACPAILYSGFVRTGDRGGFRFRLRAGQEQSGDRRKQILSGGHPAFRQRTAHGRVRRSPRYRVQIPPS